MTEPLHQMGENVFRLRNRLSAACEDNEKGLMTDDQFAAYVRRTVLGFTDERAEMPPLERTRSLTPHDHREFVPGCFRCELSRDEMDADAEPLGRCVVHGDYWTEDCYRCHPLGETNEA